MKYTEQAVETLDDAGGVIANKNIEIEQLRQRVAELEQQLTDVRRAEREKVIEKCIELGAIERDGVFAEEIREME